MKKKRERMKVKKVTLVSEAVVLAAQRGNAQAAKVVVEHHHFLVKRFVSANRPRTAEEAEDLYQEGVLGLYRAIQTYKPLPPHGNFMGWACQYLRAFIGRLRWGPSHSRGKRTIDYEVSLEEPLYDDGSGEPITIEDTLKADADVEDNAAIHERMRQARHIATRLKSTNRDIYRMRFQEGLANNDIAEVLGVSRERIRQRVKIIIRRLVACLPDAPRGIHAETLEMPYMRNSARKSRMAQGSPEALCPAATPNTRTEDLTASAETSGASSHVVG